MKTKKCSRCKEVRRVYDNGYCPDCHHQMKVKYRKGVNTKSYKEEQDTFKAMARERNRQHPIEDVWLLFKGFSYIGVFD